MSTGRLSGIRRLNKLKLCDYLMVRMASGFIWSGRILMAPSATHQTTPTIRLESSGLSKRKRRMFPAPASICFNSAEVILSTGPNRAMIFFGKRTGAGQIENSELRVGVRLATPALYREPIFLQACRYLKLDPVVGDGRLGIRMLRQHVEPAHMRQASRTGLASKRFVVCLGAGSFFSAQQASVSFGQFDKLLGCAALVRMQIAGPAPIQA